MNMLTSIERLRALSGAELEERLPSLVGEGRRNAAELILHLAEYERRRQFRMHGLPTLWEYCREKLGIRDECALWRRTRAARVAVAFPDVADRIADGRLSVTTAAMLADVIDTDNAADLLERASGRSKREVEMIVACLKPATIVPMAGVARAQPAPKPVEVPADLVPASVMSRIAAGADPAPAFVLSEPPPAPAAWAKVIGPETIRLHLSVSPEFMAKLQQAKEYLSHSVPDGNLEAVLQRALDALLERAEKRVREPARACVAAAGVRQTADDTPSDSTRYIPSAVRRSVWRRDGAACAWKRPDGKTCGSRWKLEIDHIIPVAKGGRATFENLRLLCRTHNDEHARTDFGDSFIDRKQRRGPARRTGARVR